MGGGTPWWAQALVLVAFGAVAAWRPPQQSPGRSFDIALAGLVLACGVALLPFPEGWARPRWWGEAANQFGIGLPATISPQPWLTAENLALLIGGIVAFYVIWNRPVDRRREKRLLWAFVLSVAVLALGVILGRSLGLKYPLGQEAPVFSYFPNRNQSSTLYCMAAVAAFGLTLESIRRREWGALWAAVAGALLTVALVLSLSRVGLALFVLGCLLLLLTRSRLSGLSFVVKVGLPVVLIIASLVVFLSRDNVPRITSAWQTAGTSAERMDFRVRVYQDASRLIGDQPWAGTGLGNFAYVFPQYREHSANYQSIRHPESDWVWIATEAGLPGLVFAALAVLLLMRALIPPDGEVWPYRLIPGVCAVLFLLHGLVDVAGHRFGSLLVAFFLFRLACPQAAGKRSLFPAWAFRVAGVVLVLVGAAWLVSPLVKAPLHSDARLALAQSQAGEALARRAPQEAKAALAPALAVLPLRWELHFLDARADLLNRSGPEALEAFRRARFLEPVAASVALAEGEAWLPISPRLAYQAWREALAREYDIPRDMWRIMMERADEHPRFAPYISQLSRLDSARRFVFLMRQPPKVFASELALDLRASPRLILFSPDQRTALMRRWVEFGGAAQVLAYLDGQGGGIPQAGRVRAEALAALKRYDEAVSAAREALGQPDLPAFSRFESESLASLQALYKSSGNDVIVGAAILKKQMSNGQIRDALLTANRLITMPQVPPCVHYWRAEILQQTGAPEDAWRSWEAYFRYLDNHAKPEAGSAPVRTPGSL